MTHINTCLIVFPTLLLTALTGCGGQEVPTEGTESIYEAAARGEMSYISSYINGGFDVDTPDENGRTMMHYAAAGNQTEILEVLLEEYNANGTLKDAEGKTPLDIAYERDATDAIVYLEEDQGLE